MTKKEEHKQKVIAFAKNDICMTESGYYGFDPPTRRGYLTSDDLRIIADYLDELNKEWDEQVKRDC